MSLPLLASPSDLPSSWDTALARYETHLRARRASPRTLDSYLRELRLPSR